MTGVQTCALPIWPHKLTAATRAIRQVQIELDGRFDMVNLSTTAKHKIQFSHRATLLAIMGGERVEASTDKLSAISVPTLVMWGTDDNLVPVSGAQKFADAIPNTTLAVYEGVGHLPQEENAEQSIVDVRTFMMDVEWSTVEDEAIIPAGDPTITDN